MDRQHFTYEQCVAECEWSGGNTYECRRDCRVNPYVRPQSYFYPGLMSGNQFVNPRPRNPWNDPCMRRCLDSGGSFLHCCYYCGWC